MSRGSSTPGEERAALIYKDERWIGEATHIQRKEAPTDTWRKVWLITLLFGVGGLLPWNVFITCYDFFTTNYAEYPIEFLLSVSYNYACLPMLFLMIKFGPRLEFSTKIAVTSFVTLLILFAVPIFIMVIGETWTLALTLVSVFATGITSSVLNSSAFAIGAQLPAEYITAVMSGQGIAGILAGVLRIVTKKSLPPTTAGMNIATLIYFGMAAFVMYLCIIGFFILRNSTFARYYIRWSDTRTEMTKLPEHSVSYMHILRHLWPDALNVFLAFFITLSLFPGVMLLIPSRNGIPADWFGILLIFTFQVLDFVGRTVPRWFLFPGPDLLWIPSVGRLVFFALFVMGQQNVVFTNDYWTYHRMLLPIPYRKLHDTYRFAFVALLAITNGYFGTLGMMYAPARVEDHERETAGNIMAFVLNIGIFAGVHFALVMLKILTGSFGIFADNVATIIPTPSPTGF